MSVCLCAVVYEGRFIFKVETWSLLSGRISVFSMLYLAVHQRFDPRQAFGQSPTAAAAAVGAAVPATT